MNGDIKTLGLATVGVLVGLVFLDMFGIAEQGSLKIAHRGKLGREAVKAKQTVLSKSAALYQ